MGIIRATLQLRNPSMGNALSPIEVNALVDTGAVHLCIPEHLAIQLDLVEQERREVTLAKGHSITVPDVGPVEVRFKNRRCFTGAMVLGVEALLGAIPIEDMDLVIVPGRQTVDVNPRSPNIPMSMAKVERRYGYPTTRSLREHSLQGHVRMIAEFHDKDGQRLRDEFQTWRRVHLGEGHFLAVNPRNRAVLDMPHCWHCGGVECDGHVEGGGDSQSSFLTRRAVTPDSPRLSRTLTHNSIRLIKPCSPRY